MQNLGSIKGRRALGRVVALALSVVCSGAYAQPGGLFGSKPGAADDVKPYSIVDAEGVWPGLNIPVCWEPSAKPYPQERALVERGVRKHIEGNSAFRFGAAAWPECGSGGGAVIRITANDAQAESLVGYQLRPTLFGDKTPVPTAMNLNFVFGTWGVNCAKPEAYRKQCIETIAVHEFLHALGFVHEQLSKDLAEKDPQCWAIYKDVADVHGVRPEPLTPYDPDSIMNYCRKIYEEPTRLSAYDKEGLKKLEQRARNKGQGLQTSSSGQN